MQVVSFYNRILSPYKLNEGKGISSTNEEKLHGLTAGNELLGIGYEGFLERGIGRCVRELHCNDSITGDGVVAVSEEMAFCPTIGTEHWF
jgi:hypothetical protein